MIMKKIISLCIPIMLTSLLIVLVAFTKCWHFVSFPEVFLWFTAIIIMEIFAVISLNIFVKNMDKATILVVILFIFIAYFAEMQGQLNKGLKYITPHIGRSIVSLPLHILMFSMLVLIILKNKYCSKKLLSAINVFLLCFLIIVMAGWYIGKVPYGVVTTNKYELNNAKENNLMETVKNGSIRIKPDIYYIVLDSYTSNISLKKYWNYDNSGFYTFLRANGFYVNENSKSDYSHTLYSTYSALNMEPPPQQLLGGHAQACMATAKGIQESQAIKRLKEYGYEIANFSFLKVLDAEPYYNISGWFGYFYSMKESLMDKSIISYYNNIIMPNINRNVGGTNLEPVTVKSLKIINEEIKKNIESPFFIYAHVMLPHKPFSFTSKGELKLRKDSNTATDEDYLEQLIYTTCIISNTLCDIIKKANKDTIIIIQGDHGYRFLKSKIEGKDIEGYTILNAVRLPCAEKDWFWEGMRPVDTFRLIFNKYFGANYSYLSKPPSNTKTNELAEERDGQK